MNQLYILLQIITILILIYLVMTMKKESLCIKKDYGCVTDVPASEYVNANMALVRSTSLGQAPLGDPRFWLPNRSPITQGQYGLYQPHTIPLSETHPYDHHAQIQAAAAIPVYTE